MNNSDKKIVGNNSKKIFMLDNPEFKRTFSYYNALIEFIISCIHICVFMGSIILQMYSWTENYIIATILTVICITMLLYHLTKFFTTSKKHIMSFFISMNSLFMLIITVIAFVTGKLLFIPKIMLESSALIIILIYDIFMIFANTIIYFSYMKWYENKTFLYIINILSIIFYIITIYSFIA
jgi:hypothetical protein